MKYRIEDIGFPDTYWTCFVYNDFKPVKEWCIFARYDNGKEIYSAKIDFKDSSSLGKSPKETMENVIKSLMSFTENGKNTIAITEINQEEV